MAVTREQVTELYVAFFDRAPDAAGLDYWVDSGLTMEGISESFFAQPETQAAYPDHLTDGQFIEAIYGNMFNRLPDADGTIYWENELATGSISRANMILAIANGAQDTALGQDQSILDNKTEIGLAFAEAGLNDVDDATDVMEGVTEDQSTVDTALIAIDDLATESSTSNFTTARDTIPGTDGDDIFSGVANNNVSSDTYQAFDSVDGGEGSDQVLITAASAAGFTTGAASITNVETLHVTQNGGGNVRVDAQNFDDNITNILVDGSSTATGTIRVGNGATANMHAIVDDVELATKNGAVGAQTVRVDYEAHIVAGIADVQGVTLSNGVAQTLQVNNVETFDVHTGSGAQAVTLVGAAATTIMVDGAANLNLTSDDATVAALSAAVVVNASAMTGGVTYTDTGAIANTLIGGAATDVFNGGGQADILIGNAGADTLRGGAGADTFSYVNHGDSTRTSMDVILDFNVASATENINVTEAVRASEGAGAGTDAAIAIANFLAASDGAMADGDSFTGNAGQTHAYVDTTNAAANILYVDVNQDGLFHDADDLTINMGAAVMTTAVATGGGLIV